MIFCLSHLFYVFRKFEKKRKSGKYEKSFGTDGEVLVERLICCWGLNLMWRDEY